MKLAIVGSRGINLKDLGDYLPDGVDEIVSGGARGVDTAAREYAKAHGIKLTEFLPDYETYGRRAPLVRNLEIIDYADEVYAFWDRKSHGTKYVIQNCKLRGKRVTVHVPVINKEKENDTESDKAKPE